jgi:two-component system, NarL family, response regulator DegU
MSTPANELPAGESDSMDNASAKVIQIVIADDHAVLRESLATLLETQNDMKVIGKAANGNDAVQLVQNQHPDVLLLDLFMPEGSGFDVLRVLDKEGSRVASVVLTGSDSQMDYLQVVRLGARGLVLKADDPKKLFEAIRAVAAGELWFPPDIAQGVLNAMAGDSRTETPGNIGRLSERERQIAHLVANGMRNRDIAAELHISENTVKRHLQSIFDKTGARDRLELAVMAIGEVGKAA